MEVPNWKFFFEKVVFLGIKKYMKTNLVLAAIVYQIRAHWSVNYFLQKTKCTHYMNLHLYIHAACNMPVHRKRRRIWNKNQFDLFCTSPIFICSTFSALKLTDFISNFLAKLYFDQNFTSTKTLLRPVVLDKYEVQIWQKVNRSTRVEVNRSN